MVERQSGLTLLTHAVLLAGIAVVAFPIYVTFVASTHTLDDVVRAPMPLLPGHLLVENYQAVLGHGLRSAGGAPVGRMLVNSLVMAVVIAAGKIAISLLSAFAIVYFRFPFRCRLLDDLPDAHAPRRGAHRPDLQGHRRPRHAQLL